MRYIYKVFFCHQHYIYNVCVYIYNYYHWNVQADNANR